MLTSGRRTGLRIFFPRRRDSDPAIAEPIQLFSRRSQTEPHTRLSLTTQPLLGARLVTGLGPVILAEMQDFTGPAGPTYWFLDERGEVLSRTTDASPEASVVAIREALQAAALASADGDPDALAAFRNGFVSLDRGFALTLMNRLFRTSPVRPLSLIAPLSGDENDQGRLEIKTADGGVSLIVDATLEFPILIDGSVVRQFNQGWTVRAIVTCFAPFVILELGNPDGRRASWVLDTALNRLCDEHMRAPQIQARIRETGAGLVMRYIHHLLHQTDDRPDPVVGPMLQLNSNALRAIYWHCRDRCPVIEEVKLAGMPEMMLLPHGGQAAPIALSRQATRASLGRDVYAAMVDGIRGGGLVWPSPVDGSDALLEAVFVLQDYTILYQFRDRGGLRFLLLTGDRCVVPLGLFFPDANIVVSDHHEADRFFRSLVGGGGIWDNLLWHCLGWHELMPRRRRRPDAEIVNVFIGQPLLHIGHYVWNDLSGQIRLLDDVPSRLPRSVIFGGQEGQSEFFGRLEQLMPALAGKIDRSLPDRDSFIRWSYEFGVVPIRATRNHVSKQLRDIVTTHARRTVAARDVARRLRRERIVRPVVLVGLRLEDRTFIDNESFHVGLLEHLERVLPGTIVVFDGRNSKPGGKAGEMIAGIVDHLSARSPVEAEQALVERLSSRFEGGHLRLVSTIGQPVEASLAWIMQARFCITPWGAGLAKYRWIGNLPALVLSSRFNLVHREDLDIYHSEHFMEAPSPVLFPDPAFVIDHADKIGLADSGMRAGREMFEVDMEHVTGLVDRLIGLTA